jgi:hypothetical protein
MDILMIALAVGLSLLSWLLLRLCLAVGDKS